MPEGCDDECQSNMFVLLDVPFDQEKSKKKQKEEKYEITCKDE